MNVYGEACGSWAKGQRELGWHLHRVPIIRTLSDGRWSRADTLAAIGVFVAIVAIMVPIFMSQAQSSPPSGPVSQSSLPNPVLKVDDVELAPASKIDPASKDPRKSAYYFGTFGSAIDVTLRNRGAAPALIVKATLTFMRITGVCCSLGAGALKGNGVYEVKVPSSKVVTARDRPFALQRDMRFIVGANSIDRFRISVGPDTYLQPQSPWIYEFKLTLTEDNGHELNLGQMSMLGIPGNEWINWFKSLTPKILASDPVVAGYVARARDQLAQAMANPGLHSPELESLYGRAQNLNAHA